MSKSRRWHWLGMGGFGLTLAALTGCQTWVTEAGVTLPSPHYMDHPAQYVPPSPAFPLTRELTSMEAGGVIAGAAAGAGQAAPVPGPQPPAGPVP